MTKINLTEMTFQIKGQKECKYYNHHAFRTAILHWEMLRRKEKEQREEKVLI